MRSFIPLAMLLLLLSGLCAPAEEVVLRYQWNAGEVFILDKQLELFGTVRMATWEAWPAQQRATIRKKVTVEEVSDKGEAKLRVATLLISATNN